MSYKQHKGSTPSHVNSDPSDSTSRKQHNLATKADATSVARPDYKTIQRDSALKSDADKDYKTANDALNGGYDPGPMVGNSSSSHNAALEYQRGRSKHVSDSLSADMKKASKPKGSTGPG